MVRPIFQRDTDEFSTRRTKRTHAFIGTSSESPSASRIIQSPVQAEPTGSVGSSFAFQPNKKRIRLKTQRRREQCRANQARYRQKQLDHAKSIEDAVQKLRADIPVLELQRNRLLYGGQQYESVGSGDYQEENLRLCQGLSLWSRSDKRVGDHHDGWMSPPSEGGFVPWSFPPLAVV
ncbi:hypothetical protein DVH05_019144 [Phytophthora capsici]|nr:hypothetical protein DVH05_019144 [Phytophthora capsici]